MKSITICGNLGSNAVRRSTSDGKEIMTFSVAVNDSRDNTTWFNCVSNFRERQFDFLIKGQCVCVIGDLSVAVFKDRPDLTVNVDRLELCGNAKQQPPVDGQPI